MKTIHQATMHSVRASVTDRGNQPSIFFRTTIKDSTTVADHNFYGEQAQDLLKRARTFDIAALEGRDCMIFVEQGLFVEFYDFAGNFAQD
jgi:hypothetical protein